MNLGTFDWVALTAMALAAILAIIMIVLLRRGWISKETVTAAGNLLDTIPLFSEDGFVGQLYNYCRLAVRAVEQMVKAGVLPKDDGIRKAEAVEQVKMYAKIDGMDLGNTDRDAIDTLIEAAVMELPPSE